MLYPHQPSESNLESSSESVVYSPALLALKRFVKGTLRPIAIALISLLLLLSISTYVSAETGSEPIAARVSNEVPNEVSDGAIPPLSHAFYGLKAELTDPHLTSSRLAIPKRFSGSSLGDLPRDLPRDFSADFSASTAD